MDYTQLWYRETGWPSEATRFIEYEVQKATEPEDAADKGGYWAEDEVGDFFGYLGTDFYPTLDEAVSDELARLRGLAETLALEIKRLECGAYKVTKKNESA